jgi:hypothetical protein
MTISLTDPGATDFPIAAEDLAHRLGLTRPGASWIRDKLARLRVVVRTQNPT